MKILLVASANPENIRSWSGTTYSVYSALNNIADDLVIFYSKPVFVNLISRILSKLSGRKLDFYKTGLYARYLAGQVEEIIDAQKPCIVVGIAATVELAYVKTTVPIIHISDATYQGLLKYYNNHSRVWPVTAKSSNELEQRVIDNADCVVLPSRWAVQSAINDYHCDPQKVKLIPLGANLQGDIEPPTKDAVGLDKPCTLLFVGVDWQRKGGDIVFGAMEALREKGIDAKLQVIGCEPPAHVTSPHMSVEPFLDKHNTDEYLKLVEQFSAATFLFVPTQAEAFGIVFAEAAMFGLPAISNRTGGVESVIDHDETGYLLPLGSSSDDFVEAILDIIRVNERYQEMSRRAREKYEAHLNWQVWQESMAEMITSIVTHRG